MAVKIYEYKLRANKAFVREAERTLLSCQHLYNACLEQRINHYRQTGLAVSWAQQSRELTELRADDPCFKAVSRGFQKEVLRRLDLAYQAFYRRVKSRDKAGFPRFRSRDRYNSFGWSLDPRHKDFLRGDKIHVPSVGSCRVRLSRPLEGTPKQARILRKADGWYVQITCSVPLPTPLQKTGKTVGVDVGINSFAALSTGEVISNPCILQHNARRLADAGRRLSRRKQGSKRRKKAQGLLAKRHLHIQRIRKHFHYQVANKLVREFDGIHVEKLNVSDMVVNPRFAKAIYDVAWGSFFSITQFKAEWAGREFVKKDPRYTSQTCSVCQHRQKMPLWLRVFLCEKCQYQEDRDINAAINILGAECALQMK
jgi:putative transposase